MSTQSTNAPPQEEMVMTQSDASEERSTRSWWKRPRRTVVMGICALVLVLAAGATALLVTRGSEGLPADAVLRIDDEIVTEQELDDRLAILEALYGVTRPAGESDTFQRDAAKSVAVSLILERAAQDEGIVVPDKRAADALSSIIDEQLPQGRSGFARFLEGARLTEEDVLAEVRLQLVTSELFEAITADVEAAAPEDVRAAYEERRDELVTPARRRLSNIVVATRAQAVRALARLRSGAPFAAVASAVSLDSSSREQGGDLGLVAAAELVPAYADQAFTSRPGDLFGPVKTQFGWNVGKVRGIVAGRALGFAEVQDRLAAQLLDERRYDQWRKWLADAIKDADVEYADDYRPADPDAPPSDSIS